MSDALAMQIQVQPTAADDSARLLGPPPGYKKNRRCSVSAEVVSSAFGQPTEKRVVEKDEQSRARINHLIKNNVLLSGMDEEQLQDVVNAMLAVNVEAGQEIITEGQQGDNFYVIDRGTFTAVKGGEVKFTYHGEGSFGELALMYNTPRAATIRAVTEGLLWALDRASFRDIVVASTVARRDMYDKVLSTIELFTVLSPADRAAIADCLQPELFPAGTMVLSEGEPLANSSKFYIVERGEMDCFRTVASAGGLAGDGQEVGQERQLVKTVGPGGWFGELAMLTREPRKADCIAKTDVKLLTLSREAFERLLGPSEQLFAPAIAEYNRLNAATAALSVSQ